MSSPSLHIYGFIPPDHKWNKMKAVYDSCITAEIDIPDEVNEFFGYKEPDPLGVEIALEGE